jgi:hypothetical protein
MNRFKLEVSKHLQRNQEKYFDLDLIKKHYEKKYEKVFFEDINFDHDENDNYIEFFINSKLFSGRIKLYYKDYSLLLRNKKLQRLDD